MFASLLLCVLDGHSQTTANPPALPTIPAKGMVAYKLHKQDDEFAPCVEYSSIENFPLVANMITMDRRFLSVQQGQIAYRIDYPAPNEELLRDEDITRLEKRIKEYETISKRFRYSAKLLAPWIARFRHELDMMQQGLGRAEGHWIPRASYAYERDREHLRAKFEARKAEILHGRGTDPNAETPPLWASALEAQRLAQQLAFRKAFKEKVAAKEVERAEEFHRTTDSKLTPKSASRLAPAELAPDTSLKIDGELENSGNLQR
ncbi:MAG: hypothetical protein O3C21_14805 [Verrucomicrobia bacterium]|nr:hypothetical protein [Verrucomicrobiota bacterium]